MLEKGAEKPAPRCLLVQTGSEPVEETDVEGIDALLFLFFKMPFN
jgi:hypothetical protein